MAALLNPKTNTPAEFVVNDGQGNSVVGHLELTFVPSFNPGTRCGDLTFVIDERKSSSPPNQVQLDPSLVAGS